VKKGLPCYQEAFSTAVELIPFPADQKLRVLDLGAGTGLFSWHVLQKYSVAEFILLDVATQMLDVARSRFNEVQNQVSFVVDDYVNLDETDAFDLIISSLSIHHLPHSDKRKLFRSVHTVLKPKGVFINLDQIKGETKAIEELYWTTWLEKVRLAGGTEEQIVESCKRRQEFDKDARLTDQLKWLEQAGFADVDCVYKSYFIGVFLATKRLTALCPKHPERI
jgi:tRNA (cmo5U34)-methyltransferase